MTEKELDAAIRELAVLCGWRRYHTYRSIRSPAGFPDLVLVRPPRVIFAELKSDDGIVTALQSEWLDDLRRCPGVEAYLWRPTDLEEIGKVLSPV